MGLGIFKISKSVFDNQESKKDSYLKEIEKIEKCNQNRIRELREQNQKILDQINKINNKNPNPNYYLIKKHKTIGDFLIVFINYPNCVNYEGNKILVFEKCTIQDLLKQEMIDPHFSNNKSYLSPIARFEPTKKGYQYAISFCENA